MTAPRVSGRHVPLMSLFRVRWLITEPLMGFLVHCFLYPACVLLLASCLLPHYRLAFIYFA